MISIEDVEYVARLARLSFTEEEKEQMARELSGILDYMKQMDELDTSNVASMAHVLDRVDVFRPDVTHERISHDQALSNAPDSDGEHFRVPRVIPSAKPSRP
ncbi:MAG: Asp-tRNA(Asn)/Glu-tRNA(Gln) amidotransferase subunit GatC [Rhodothermales bacterium]|nr:Asp-tRNA(Asn)/Glu-tRNA(Gln) amidotransferase subunit GatC [Rhodothermales bacterium]